MTGTKPIGQMLPQEVDMELARLRRQNAKLLLLAQRLRQNVEWLTAAHQRLGQALGISFEAPGEDQYERGTND